MQTTHLYQKVASYIIDSYGEGSLTVRHLKRTAEWAKKLDPNADEAMLIAALSHDIERADKHRKDWGNDYMTNPDYLKHHQERGGEMMADFLTQQGAAAELAEQVRELISKHEVGGTDDQNFLKDMDSLSYFENNVEHFLNKYVKDLGKEEVRKKFTWMFDRITSEKVKELANPYYKDALTKLELM